MFTEPGDWALTVAVASSLFLIVVFSTVFGALVPLTLEKLKINPALATGPFIQITNDVVGPLIYVGMAVWSLKLLPDVMAKEDCGDTADDTIRRDEKEAPLMRCSFSVSEIFTRLFGRRNNGE